MFPISECKDTHLDVRAVLAADGDEQGEARLGAPPVRLLPIFQAAVLVLTCCRGGKKILPCGHFSLLAHLVVDQVN